MTHLTPEDILKMTALLAVAIGSGWTVIGIIIDYRKLNKEYPSVKKTSFKI